MPLIFLTRSRSHLLLFLACPFCSRNSLAEMCIGIICSCMPSLSSMLQHHLFHFATFQSLIFSYFNYFSDRCYPSAESEVLTLYKPKVKRAHLELETGSMPEYCGDEDSRLEVLQQYDGVEERGSQVLHAATISSCKPKTSKFRRFENEGDRIQLKLKLTVISVRRCTK